MDPLCLANYLTKPQKKRLNVNCFVPNCEDKAYPYNNGKIYYSCIDHKNFVKLNCSSCKRYIELGEDTYEIRLCKKCTEEKTICKYCSEIHERKEKCKCNKTCKKCKKSFNSCDQELYCANCLNSGLICCHKVKILWKEKFGHLNSAEKIEMANLKASEFRKENPNSVIHIAYLCRVEIGENKIHKLIDYQNTNETMRKTYANDNYIINSRRYKGQDIETYYKYHIVQEEVPDILFGEYNEKIGKRIFHWPRFDCYFTFGKSCTFRESEKVLFAKTLEILSSNVKRYEEEAYKKFLESYDSCDSYDYYDY
jgi:hypothetical protein